MPMTSLNWDTGEPNDGRSRTSRVLRRAIWPTLPSKPREFHPSNPLQSSPSNRRTLIKTVFFLFFVYLSMPCRNGRIYYYHQLLAKQLISKRLLLMLEIVWIPRERDTGEREEKSGLRYRGCGAICCLRSQTDRRKK
ncbi:hypothetical protein GWI33_022348 [Rhynchophorus ferrugineus]|uniref:Uncharacterized protein n=1 Tax=Rhynchophorus ferrugineus TaxID=354439 RepID=A0A834M253_RHYFE|nr:hypothetical protein GWI33_022350 [Rhynchophorus ferrugineus]KAF7264796.1 hypothetical protein GWI33_022348 [Rhynchophorus ferrugineus]